MKKSKKESKFEKLIKKACHKYEKNLLLKKKSILNFSNKVN